MNIAKTSTKTRTKSSEAPKGEQDKPRSVELLREPVELYKVLKFQQPVRLKRKLKSRSLSPPLKKTGAGSARQLRLMPTQAWCQSESRRERREALKAGRRVQRLAR